MTTRRFGLRSQTTEARRTRRYQKLISVRSLSPWFVCVVVVLASVWLRAQVQLDPALLGKPPVDAWPTYHGDYSGRRYSTLNQIHQSNVKNLALSWTYRANTNTQGAISAGAIPEAVAYRLGPGALAGGLLKATPLAVNGVLYMSAPDHAWAIDAYSGREI